MKSYDHFVVWLSYFDSELKQREGRRLPLHSCVRSPTLEELVEACRRLKLEPEPQQARYPKSVQRPSGYVSIKKIPTKMKLLVSVARELSVVRGEKAQKR